MVDYLYANNYKSFVNFRIEFDKMNLLLGRNGSGKSNILRLIALLRDFTQMSNNNVNAVFPTSTLTRWMKSDIQTFELGLSAQEHKYAYKLEILHDTELKQGKIKSEKVICDDTVIYQMENGSAIMYDDNSERMPILVDPTVSGIVYVPIDGMHKKLQGFKELLMRIVLCIPNPRLMEDIVQNDVYIPKVDFSNIASTYVGLSLLDPDIAKEITDALRDIDTTMKKIRISPEGTYKYLRFDYQYEDVQCSYVLSELSDGERMLFALYALLFGFIKRGSTVLLDEPDNYISSREIQPWCMAAEEILNEQGQCVLISHHPEVIDYLAETKGLWMTRNKSGESRITDPPLIEDNGELLTYSQMIARGLLDEIE